MTSEELQKIIDDYAPNILKTRDQRRYFEGKNTGIFLPPPKADPDNRLPVTIPRRATLLLKGYMLGPDCVKYSGDFYDEALKEIYESEEESLTSADEFIKSCVHGRCYEYHWYGTDEKPHFAPIPIDQARAVLSDDLKPKITKFVWNRSIKIGTETVELATYLDETTRQEWKKAGDAWVLEEEALHFYGKVPVCVARIDADYANLFDHVLPMVDALDRLVSGSIADELERFAEAYLLLRDRIDSVTQDDNGMTQVDRLKLTKTFDGLGDNVTQAVAFLTKSVNGSFIAESADRLERLIYEMLMIQNPNDKDFGSGDSGVAQAWKAWGQELLAASIESYWQRFLQDRVRMIGGLLINLRQWTDSEAVNQVVISMERNIPKALSEIADTAAKLVGTLSKKTIIRLFPDKIIGSVDDELKRLEDESPDLNMEEVANAQQDQPAIDADNSSIPTQ